MSEEKILTAAVLVPGSVLAKVGLSEKEAAILKRAKVRITLATSSNEFSNLKFNTVGVSEDSLILGFVAEKKVSASEIEFSVVVTREEGEYPGSD